MRCPSCESPGVYLVHPGKMQQEFQCEECGCHFQTVPSGRYKILDGSKPLWVRKAEADRKFLGLG